jgi:hypothetical protein
MNIEMINPYTLKILLSAREEDSISSVSRRIGLSYGWTNKWVNKLINEGILNQKWRGFELNKTSSKYKNIIKFIRQNFNNVRFYYSVLNLFGIEYCFTKTDAVYLWTEGRYNIARYRDYYPIFIKIKASDYPLFLEYCRKLGLKINSNKGIFYSPEIAENIKSAKKNKSPVETLDSTIDFMKENIYNFQPALEMVQEMYSKELNIKYSEANG